MIVALQTANEFGVATPADWVSGDDVILGSAGSCGAAKDRADGKDENIDDCQDWFFCTKKLDKDTVLKKILKK